MERNDRFSSAEPVASCERPTRVRYVVLGLLCALSFVLYVDRICIGKAAPNIKGDLGLSDTALGFVFGAFTVAYGLFEVPTGHWGDRYGSRGVLLRIVLWWSAFTALTGCVWPFALDSGLRLTLPGMGWTVPLLFDSFLLLVVIRFLFGAGEAGALPNSARVVARWFPPDGRGPAQGLINTTALIGGALAPIVAAYAIQAAGWRWSFAIFGLLGVAWALVFAALYRDDPARHPAVNRAEYLLITGSAFKRPDAGHHESIPWGRVLLSANVWLLGGVITCTAFTTYLFFFWFPTYLEKGRSVGPIASGWLSGLVLAGGAIGSTLGGFLGDGLVRWTGDQLWTRRLIGCGSQAGAAVLMLASLAVESPVIAASLMALACLSAALMVASWWACVTQISGKHLGALFGLMNSMGVPGAFGSQVFFGWFIDWMKEQGYQGRAQMDPAFYVYASVLSLGAVGWLFIDPTRSAVAPPSLGHTPSLDPSAGPPDQEAQ